VSPLQSNVDVVSKMAAPTSVRVLKSFSRSVGIYIRFIPDFATTAEPLYELLRGHTLWRWNSQCTEAFDASRQALTSKPVLVHIDTAAETEVDYDILQMALGCVLLQVQDGVERPVAFASRVLNEHELVGYSVSEKEALVCIYASEHWHYYLYGRKFKLRTDHSALTTLLRKGEGRRPLRLQRWHDRLYWYPFDKEYKPGNINCIADMLSCNPVGAPGESDVDVWRIFSDTRVTLVTEKELVEAIAVDPELCEVKKGIRQVAGTGHGFS
jgi:hypothetical protein